MFLILVLLTVGYVWFCFQIAKKYKLQAQRYGLRRRLSEKPVVLALLYGWGFIATTGFGLPAPLVASLLFTDKRYWLDTAIYPFAFWIIIFAVKEFRNYGREVRLRDESEKGRDA